MNNIYKNIDLFILSRNNRDRLMWITLRRLDDISSECIWILGLFGDGPIL